jgi:ribosomal protein L35AE/L33A
MKRVWMRQPSRRSSLAMTDLASRSVSARWARSWGGKRKGSGRVERQAPQAAPHRRLRSKPLAGGVATPAASFRRPPLAGPRLPASAAARQPPWSCSHLEDLHHRRLDLSRADAAVAVGIQIQERFGCLLGGQEVLQVRLLHPVAPAGGTQVVVQEESHAASFLRYRAAQDDAEVPVDSGRHVLGSAAAKHSTTGLSTCKATRNLQGRELGERVAVPQYRMSHLLVGVPRGAVLLQAAQLLHKRDLRQKQGGHNQKSMRWELDRCP